MRRIKIDPLWLGAVVLVLFVLAFVGWPAFRGFVWSSASGPGLGDELRAWRRCETCSEWFVVESIEHDFLCPQCRHMLNGVPQ